MHNATKRAIEAFKAAVVAEEQAVRANQLVNRLVTQVPAADMAEYVRQTEGFR